MSISYNVRINADKFVFDQKSLEFLGHLIDSVRIQLLYTKVEAIQENLASYFFTPAASISRQGEFL